MTPARRRIALCGTWTLDPLQPVLAFWAELLRIDAGVSLAPYAQLFQQLHDPASALRRNASGANVVCLRWTDLLPPEAARGGDPSALRAARVDELAAALSGFTHAAPCLVLCGPEADAAAASATAALAAKLAGVPGIEVVDGAAVMARYGVAAPLDEASDRFGHVPYTAEAIAALGTAIARWHAAHARPPVKLFAVDGDHTLWSGVVGEAGVAALEVTAGHVALQQALRRQSAGGRLLCLLSKNEAGDARAVFDTRADMHLTWDDFVAHRADWNAKPDNLREVAAALELGLDSMVFLDDNPVECAQMRAQSPATLTVRVPADAARLAAFVEHLWLFDQHGLTEEDRRRAGMYRENAARAESRRDAGSLQAFLDGLALEVSIEAPAAGDVARLAQLTQRTNQFNASLLRLQEAELASGLPDAFHRAVRARDRFGDYGLVGQLRAAPDDDALVADLFMLSCRALGRGIEHRMLAALGEHALALGLETVAVRFRAGERNTPVRRFLEAAFDARVDGDETLFRMPAAQAARTAFNAEQMPDGGSEDADAAVPSAAPATDLGAVYEHIAHALTTGRAIADAIAAQRQPRPDLGTGYTAPAAGMEREIAGIWQQALRLEAVGAHDPFHALGGKSIHLVQVHRLLLERLGVDVDITTLFQHPTVASLAAHLAPGAGAARSLDAAQQRGQRMREAQARAAARRHPQDTPRTRAGA
jgi:FkbH-like protein